MEVFSSYHPSPRPEGQTDIEYIQHLIRAHNSDPDWIAIDLTAELIELMEIPS